MISLKTHDDGAYSRTPLNGKSYGMPFLSGSRDFVGRAKELREIAFHLGGATAGQPQNILLTGADGVGKTRLIGHLSSAHKLARKWAWVRASAIGSDDDSWSFLIGRLLGGLRIAVAGVRSGKGAGKRKGTKDAGGAEEDTSMPQESADTADLSAAARRFRNAVSREIIPSGRKGLILAVDDAHLLCSHNPAFGNRLQALLDLALAAQDGPHPVNLVLSGLPRLKRRLEKCRNYRAESFQRCTLGDLPPADARQLVRKWAAGIGLKTEFKPYARELQKLAGGNPQMLSMWCGEIFAALLANPERRPKDVLAAVGERVGSALFERHWLATTARERELLRLVSETAGEKGGFALQDLVEQARRSGVRLANSNARQILVRLESKDMLYAKAHGKYHATVPLLDDFVRRMGAGD